MIRKTVKVQHQWIKNDSSKYQEKSHKETVIITTVWFLFIPLYKTYKLLEYTLA